MCIFYNRNNMIWNTNKIYVELIKQSKTGELLKEKKIMGKSEGPVISRICSVKLNMKVKCFELNTFLKNK